MRRHQSAASSSAKPVLVFPSTVNASKENKQRHKALSVGCVCLDLTLVCVSVWVCVTVHICVANHIKEWQSSSVVKTPDPGVLQSTRTLVEKIKKKQLKTYKHTKKWAPNGLFNSHTDLWVNTTSKWCHNVRGPLIPLKLWRCPQSILNVGMKMGDKWNLVLGWALYLSLSIKRTWREFFKGDLLHYIFAPFIFSWWRI